MKKDNDDRIIKNSLSTLLKRFSQTDVIKNIEQEYSSAPFAYIKLTQIDDNHVVKKAKISDEKMKQTEKTLKEKGITNPLVVFPTQDGRFEIIASRLVFLCAKKLGMETVPCNVVNIEEEEMLMLLATSLRDMKNTNWHELCLILSKLKKKYKYSQKDIAEFMHFSRAQVTNIIRLSKLPLNVLNDLANDKISFGHVRAIATLPIDEMQKYVEFIYENDLSVRETEKIIYQYKHNVDFTKFEKKIDKKYNCKTNITKNRITIIFETEEEQQNFIEKLVSK